MTVTELITILLQYPGNTEVDTYGYPICPDSVHIHTGDKLYLNIPADILIEKEWITTESKPCPDCQGALKRLNAGGDE